MAFAGGTLFAAGGKTTINGTSCPGAVRALDPANGAVIWEHPAPGAVIPALAYDNGLVIDGAGSTMEVLNSATGSALYTYTAGNVFYGAPSVAAGKILIGSTDGNVYAFAPS